MDYVNNTLQIKTLGYAKNNPKKYIQNNPFEALSKVGGVGKYYEL